MQNKNLGYLFISFPILFWGLAPIIVGLGLEYIDALPFLFFRFLLSFILTLPYILIYKRIDFIQLIKSKWTWFVGLSQTWAITFQYLSQIYISPSLSSAIAYSYLIFVPIVSAWFLNMKIEVKHYVTVAIALIGVGIITISSVNDNLSLSIPGILLALSSSLGFAFYIVLVSRLINHEIEKADSITLFFIIMIIVSLSTLTLNIIFRRDINPIDFVSKVWLYIILLSVLSTIIAYITYIMALRYISANHASVLLLLQIVVPFAIEYFVYHISYSMEVLFGTILIIGSSAMVIKLSGDKLH